MSSSQGPEAAPASAADPTAADWPAICRRIVAVHKELFADVTGVAARTQYEGIGEGGDFSLVIDRRCEDVIFAELQQLASAGASFTAVSEERGEVEMGEPGSPTRVVIDPIDGSLNARRTIPSHSLSIAVASGGSMADVEFGYVYDFGAGEEFIARRGEGAQRDGEPIQARLQESDRALEILGVEAAKPELLLPLVQALQGDVYRLRVIGSLAISLCYLACGRFDAMLGLRHARSVDVAAGQLIAREAGAKVAFGDLDPEAAGLGLDERYPMAGAVTEEGLEIVLAALSAVEGG
ncbi:MAG: inositol monophosphatase family protein [Actinomycetota bacterium]